MLEELIECIVKRILPGKALAGRCGMISLDGIALLAVMIGIANAPAFMFLYILGIVVMIFLTWLVFRNTDLEYEYSFFDGEITIDKIMHRGGRKRIGVYDFKRMDFMAPDSSPRFGGGLSHTLVECSTNNPADKSYVAVVYDEKGNAVDLHFTPNEEMVEAIKKIAPRKVYED